MSIKRTGKSLIIALVVLFGALSQIIYIHGYDEKIVTIGFYSGDNRFQDGFSDDVRKSGYAYDYYQALRSLAGWEYEYVYGSRSEIMDKLEAGEIDMAAGIHRSPKLMDTLLFADTDMNVPNDEQYFAVAKDRPDLLDELNLAQAELLRSQPNFTLALQEKYYGNELYQEVLSEQERHWLNELGELKLGYMKDNLPISDVDDKGNAIGVTKVIAEFLSQFLLIPVKPIPFDSMADMIKAQEDGVIDAAFPRYSDLWLAEQNHSLQTVPIISDRVMILYQGQYSKDILDTVAVSKVGIGDSHYLSLFYPKSKTVMYPNRLEAAKGVANGEADSMIVTASVMQKLLSENPDLQNFNIAYLENIIEFGLTVDRNNVELYPILNKAVMQIDKTTINAAMMEYASKERTYTLQEFIRANSILAVGLLTAFFGILLISFIIYRRRTNTFTKKLNSTNEALKDALNAANAANQAKTTFLSSMSHDIRTPMNGIIGMTAIAGANLNNQDKLKDCLTKITASSKHLLALINEVLDMSKIESGEIFFNEEQFNISDAVDSLLSLNKPLADQKHQHFSMRINNLEHETVISDSLRLQQVLTNLVSNAIKYTPDGGTIEVTLEETKSNSPLLANYKFTVKDSGIGISKEFIPRIFEPFSRDQNKDSHKTQGTGLGLAIANNIIHMMDGEISVESEPGKGSTFTATFSLKLPESEITFEKFPDIPVLVVDDDQTLCESTALTLTDLGMICETTNSGAEAVKMVRKHHEEKDDYFAILLDWKMPNMDGVETARQIRETVDKEIPIIIITAYDWSAIEKEAIAAGVNGFIQKPLFKSRLSHLFEQLLSENKTSLEIGDKLTETTSNADLEGAHLLLAEDNDLNAEIAIEILEMAGISADWAQNGAEAVRMFNASEPGKYDCILMDVQMPVMNGLEAASAIRDLNHPDAKTIPIFAMTANAFLEDVQSAHHAGMNEHLAKPVDPESLFALLKKYLKKKNQ